MRSNWKSKNFNPQDDPTKYDSSTDESEVAENERQEMKDRVDTDFNQTPYKSANNARLCNSAKP